MSDPIRFRLPGGASNRAVKRAYAGTPRSGRLAGFRAAAALVAGAILLTATPAASQASSQIPDPDEIRATIDSLYREFQAVDREIRAREAALGQATSMEGRLAEVSVGPLRIAALPEDTAEARAAFQAAWPQYEAMTSGAESVFDGVRYLFVGPGSEVPELRGEQASAEEDAVIRVDPGLWYSPVTVSSRTRRAIGETIVEGLPEAVERWAGSAALPTAPNLEEVFRSLVSTPSRAVRQCYRVGGVWCWESLGVTDAENPWLRWYEPEELRSLAEDARNDPRSLEQRRLLETCVTDGGAEACAAYLDERLGTRAPLGNPVKLSLLRFALDRGGPGAVERLLNAEGSVDELLARAAGTNPNGLIDEWRDAALATRPRPYSELPRSASGAVIWTLILGALATRSTRWRAD